MKSHRTPKGPSQRQLRVGEQIRHIIAETMRRGHFRNDELQNAGDVTVTEVRISPDLKNATAFVISLGGKEMDDILGALNSEHQTFQKEINRQSNLKFTPRIRFKYDETFESVKRLDEILNNIHYSSDDEE